MLDSFLVILREGLETLMIIAVAWIFIKKTQEKLLINALILGSSSAIAASLILGAIFNYLGGVSPIWEGTMALVSAILVASCTYHMCRYGPKMSEIIQNELKSAIDKGKKFAFMAVFSACFILIVREGVEIAAILVSLVQYHQDTSVLVGSILGMVGAFVVAYSWVRYGRKSEMRIVFQASTIFMSLFAVQLVFMAFHEFTEVSAIPFIDNDYWHIVTEDFAPEGEYGEYITFAMMIVPFFYLASRNLWTRNFLRKA